MGARSKRAPVAVTEAEQQAMWATASQSAKAESTERQYQYKIGEFKLWAAEEYKQQPDTMYVLWCICLFFSALAFDQVTEATDSDNFGRN